MLFLEEYDGGIYQHKWIDCIKQIRISVGRPDLLNKEVIKNPKSIKKIESLKLYLIVVMFRSGIVVVVV